MADPAPFSIVAFEGVVLAGTTTLDMLQVTSTEALVITFPDLRGGGTATGNSVDARDTLIIASEDPDIAYEIVTGRRNQDFDPDGSSEEPFPFLTLEIRAVGDDSAPIRTMFAPQNERSETFFASLLGNQVAQGDWTKGFESPSFVWFNTDFLATNLAPTITGTVTEIETVVDEEQTVDLDLSSVKVEDLDTLELTVRLSLTSTEDTGAKLSFKEPVEGGPQVQRVEDEDVGIEITGTADQINTYLGTQGNITYRAQDELSSPGTDGLTITVTDGEDAPVPLTEQPIEITVNPADDAPEGTGELITPITVGEDPFDQPLGEPLGEGEGPARDGPTFTLAGFEITDVDSTDVTVTLRTENPDKGVLTFNPFFSGFEDDGAYASLMLDGELLPGQGDDDINTVTGTFLTISGDLALINQLLSDPEGPLVYFGKQDVFGEAADTLTVFADSGTGPDTEVEIGSFDINISPTPDAPTEQVSISGTPRVGQTLTANLSTLVDPDLAEGDAPENVTYQWYRAWDEEHGQGGGAPIFPGELPPLGGDLGLNGPKGDLIEGATGARYSLTAEDLGKTVFVVVTYTDSAGQDQSTSEISAEVGRAINLPNPNEGEVLEGSGGDDALTGGDKNDTIRSDDGDDRLSGRKGDDSIDGGLGDDTIGGGQGRDTLNGGDDDDLLLGRKGGDSLFGDSGEDTLRGNQGQDRLEGGDEDDRLFGNLGNDRLNGGRGEDTLNGGSGDDVLTGGAGDDIFIFRDKFGQDRITDFEIGEDIIRIRGSADDVSDLTFTQFGNAVIVSFAETEIFVNNVTIDEINNPDNFLFG